MEDRGIWLRRIAGFQDVLIKQAVIILGLLVLIDVIFFALHIVAVRTNLPSWELFRIDVDDAYAEKYQYLKWAAISLLFLGLSYFYKFKGYMVWALIFFYLLCDDIFQIHENLGNDLANRMFPHPPFGFRPHDVGEVCIAAIIGIVFLVMGGAAYRLGDNRFRRLSIHMLVLILLLAFFGVVMDAVHAVLGGMSWRIDVVLASIEDGGEMASASLMCSYLGGVFGGRRAVFCDSPQSLV